MQVLRADLSREDAGRVLTQSLHETGFGVIDNHTISDELMTQVYDSWEKFFQSEEKFDYKYQLDPETGTQNGYVPADVAELAVGAKVKDIKEFYCYYSWGRCPDSLKHITSELYGQLNELAAQCLSWIEEFTPADIKASYSRHLPDMMGTKETQLRVNSYPPLTDSIEEGAVRAAAHEDTNMITLLLAGTQPGLQIQDKHGNWYDVEAKKGQLVINIGDMLDMITTGYYPATTHRVINPVGEAAKLPRYSLPFFVGAQSDVVLKQGLTAGDFLLQRMHHHGLK